MGHRTEKWRRQRFQYTRASRRCSARRTPRVFELWMKPCSSAADRSSCLRGALAVRKTDIPAPPYLAHERGTSQSFLLTALASSSSSTANDRRAWLCCCAKLDTSQTSYSEIAHPRFDRPWRRAMPARWRSRTGILVDAYVGKRKPFGPVSAARLQSHERRIIVATDSMLIAPAARLVGYCRRSRCYRVLRGQHQNFHALARQV